MKGGKPTMMHMAAWWLVIIGAINLGLVGAFDYDLLAAIFGSVVWLHDIVLILVGLSGVMAIVGMMKMMKK